MFEIPPRPQSSFVRMNPRLRTSYGGSVVRYTMRREHESPYSDGFVAFPIAMLPSLDCVRIDFRTILAERYRSEQVGVSPDGVGVEVSDKSNFKSEQLARYPYETVYDSMENIGLPESVFRHFSLRFDEYGQIDVLARSARILPFEREWNGTAGQFDRHKDLLDAAINLGWSEGGWQ